MKRKELVSQDVDTIVGKTTNMRSKRVNRITIHDSGRKRQIELGKYSPLFQSEKSYLFISKLLQLLSDLKTIIPEDIYMQELTEDEIKRQQSEYKNALSQRRNELEAILRSAFDFFKDNISCCEANDFIEFLDTLFVATCLLMWHYDILVGREQSLNLIKSIEPEIVASIIKARTNLNRDKGK